MEKKKIVKVLPLPLEKAKEEAEEQPKNDSENGSENTSYAQKEENMRKNHKELVRATVQEYMTSNPGHSESPEQLFDVIDRLFTFFDVFLDQNGPTKLKAFFDRLLRFDPDTLDFVWQELLKLFEQNREFMIDFDDDDTEVDVASKTAYISH